MSDSSINFGEFDLSAYRPEPRTPDPEVAQAAAAQGMQYSHEHGGWIANTAQQDQQVTHSPAAERATPHAPQQSADTTEISFSFSVRDPHPEIRAAIVGGLGAMFMQSSQPYHPYGELAGSAPRQIESGLVHADADDTDEDGYLEVEVINPHSNLASIPEEAQSSSYGTGLDELADYDAAEPVPNHNERYEQPAKTKKHRVRRVVGAVALSTALTPVFAVGGWTYGYYETSGHLPSLTDIMSAVGSHTIFSK